MANRTIRNESSLEEREVDELSLPFFLNQEGWVLVDAAGRKAAHQPTTSSTTEKKD